MASSQEPCLVRIYRSRPNGDKTKILQQRVEQLAPAGGSADANPANVSTPEKLLMINSNVVLTTDDLLLVSVEADSSDTLDASDCIWSIPLLTTSGSNSLSRANFVNPTLSDTPLTAGVETFVAGYRVTEPQARLSGKIYMDFQDDS